MALDVLTRRFIILFSTGILLLSIISCKTEPDVEAGLAATPPMGWNSWNCFQADIDEEKIREIADIMVSSGMRDAGYEYLVIDDGWMAPERNDSGQLVADPEKFPSGMKALGDYIHSKGLKYGIYECRGYLTCQGLPGSFEHEQTDMNSFAEWGVDYIKLDACYAEKNGRLSSEDLEIYRQAIENTGRPMILSISDFGNGAWSWEGEKYGQLWRTSYDIYPWIGSVYNCAESSGGDGSIHPEFNGLWQFAGPGHWNDPDMLQVGNLEKTIEDKAHFSLWCILAAPLMAGNDLRSMSDTVAEILTAPEVIAINQDVRGHQGYKIYNEGDADIYNKPLADGTAAVLLINRGDKPVDLTLHFSKIGLKGKQPVRDLWEREDMGYFRDSFSVENLSKNEHKLIKVGKKGKPLPGPQPLDSARYIITENSYLSDFCYVVRQGPEPGLDKSFGGEKNIILDGVKYSKGIGVKSKSYLIYKVDDNIKRLQGIVGIDESSPDNQNGRFRVLVEDAFGGRPVFDSGQMKKGDKPVKMDVDIEGLDQILLEFTGKNMVGNWGDIQALVD